MEGAHLSDMGIPANTCQTWTPRQTCIEEHFSDMETETPVRYGDENTGQTWRREHLSHMETETPVRHGDENTGQTWRREHLSHMEAETPVRHGDENTGQTWRREHLSDMETETPSGMETERSCCPRLTFLRQLVGQ